MPADPDRYRALDPDAAGHRIAELLDDLVATVPHDVWARVAELAGLLATVHGAGLARVLDRARALPDGKRLVDALVADPLVASLLAVHDLLPAEPPAGGRPVRLAPPSRRR